jgi:hypothetical protein
MRWLAVLGVSVAFVSSAAAAQLAVATGIDAVVVRRPPEIQCIKAPCWAPVRGVPVSFVREGKVVARVVTGNDGHARAKLSPGSYVVRAPGVPLLPGHKVRLVRVVAGSLTKVTLPLGVKTSGGSGPGQ